MKKTVSYKLNELATNTNSLVIGNGELIIDGTNSLEALSNHQIAFSESMDRQPPQNVTDVAVISQHKDYNQNNEGISILLNDQPYLTFARISQMFKQRPEPQGIHPTVVIDETATISNAHIGPHSVVGKNCVIEDQVYIGPNCTIMAGSVIKEGTYLVANCTIGCNSVIGMNSIIHPGVVIGADGFGFAETSDGEWIKIEQQGNVVIGNDVEIGANTTIDCATFGSTSIGDNAKIDNQVMIAHNVQIGAHTAIAGCVGIAGSTTIGSYCKIAGQVGINGHITIADKVTILSRSVVYQSIKQAGVYAGSPCQEYKKAIKNLIIYKNLYKKLNTKR